MDKDYTQEHENLRKKLWINTYVAYVSSSNSTNENGAYKWANIALERFDEKFPLIEEK